MYTSGSRAPPVRSGNSGQTHWASLRVDDRQETLGLLFFLILEAKDQAPQELFSPKIILDTVESDPARNFLEELWGWFAFARAGVDSEKVIGNSRGWAVSNYAALECVGPGSPHPPWGKSFL